MKRRTFVDDIIFFFWLFLIIGGIIQLLIAAFDPVINPP